MKKMVMMLALAAVGCEANPDEAMRALEAQGLTHVTIAGYPFFACGEGDNFNSAFSARGVNGDLVEGAVCCGWMKGCTVRFK